MRAQFFAAKLDPTVKPGASKERNVPATNQRSPFAWSAAESADGMLARLPARFGRAAWFAVIVGFVASYGFMFTVIHPMVDTRICLARLPDPLFNLIPFDPRWYFVSHEMYYVFTAASAAGLIATAVRGEQRPLMRYGLGLSLMAAFRSVTLTLLPLCRLTVEPGTAPLAAAPTVDVGFAQIPLRLWATNDLVFSGHVAEFLLMFWVTRGWPSWWRISLLVFQGAQAYALIATRGHYTIDVVVAIPFAMLADLTALRFLAWRASRNAASTVVVSSAA